MAVQSAASLSRTIRVTSVKEKYGTVGYAASLAAKPGSSATRIGVMVAANSGRPAGSIGQGLELERIPTIDHIAVKSGFNGKLRTQEESVVSEWLHGEHPGNGKEKEQERERLFRSTICGLWGQRARQSHETIQGVDYMSARAADYGDAWVVRDAKLRHRTLLGTVTATLVFVAGPNAKAGLDKPTDPDDYGSMYYTANKKAASEYKEFKDGVEASVRAGLLAMKAEGITHALVAYVSGGIYAGAHRSKIRREFEELVRGVASAIAYNAAIVIVDRLA